MGISNVSSNLRPGVCTSTTRPTAPFDGQVIYETDTDRTLVWNNSAWVDVSTGKAGKPGLVLVKTQTIGSAVSSVTVSDAFSDDFENYKIIITGGSGSTALNLRFNFDGSTASYYSGVLYVPYSQTTPGNSSGVGISNAAYWDYFGNANTSNIMCDATVLSPKLSKISGFSSQYVVGATDGSAVTSSGFHNVATSYTSFRIQTSTGTLTGGTIRVYGYNQ